MRRYCGRTKKSHVGIIYKLLLLISFSIGISGNLYLIVRFLSGDNFLLIRLGNYLLPWFGLLIAINLFAAALIRKWILATTNLPLTIFLLIVYAPLFFGCGSEPDAFGHVLRVMSYNVHEYNRDMAKTATLICKQHPDILFVQEIPVHRFRLLVRFISANPDHGYLYYEHDSATLQGFISRFPLGEVKSSFDKNRLLRATAYTPQGAVTLLNIHAFKNGWRDRHERLLKLLSEDVTPEKGPLILAGDFNTTDQSETFRMVVKHLEDVQQEAACGLNFSFPTPAFFMTAGLPLPPMLRIDHILHNGHFRAVRAYAIKESGGSDHYPVMAELVPTWPSGRLE